jgi:predicted metal-dependent hydrolase
VGWKVAFLLMNEGIAIGVSTWGRPVARLEEQINTLEHTRMALSDEAPKNSASWFLARNREWIREWLPEIKRLIAYVDLEQHKVVSYLADNWRVIYKKRSDNSWNNRPGRQGKEAKLRMKVERRP